MGERGGGEVIFVKKKIIGKSKDTGVGRLFEVFLRDYVHVEDMAADFRQLTPYQRLALLEKFASYVWPKMKSIEMEVCHEERSPGMISLIRHLAETGGGNV